jgi:hypothetical protein
MALEEGGEVPEVSRRTYLRGASGVDASNPSAGIEALAQRSAVKQRIIMMVGASETVASPTVLSHQLRPCHVFGVSTSSHGPLTAWLMHAVGGPSSFRGPRPFASSRGCAHGPGSRGLLSVLWIPGYPGPPATGPRHQPIFSQRKDQ